MRGLVILVGESFRDGKRGSRATGTSQSPAWQKEATESHIQFLKHIEQKHNLTLDISLNTYGTNYTKDLIDWYSSDFNVIRYFFGIKQEEAKHKHTTEINKTIKNAMRRDYKNADYDFTFVLRFDLVLKQCLFDVFDPNWTTIRFPFVWFWREGKTEKFECGYSFPVVSDVMLFLPKKFFDTLFEFHLDLNSWKDLICNEDLALTYDDMDVMVDTMHRLNSQDMRNPLYKMVSRPEHPRKSCSRETFNKYRQNEK